MTPRFGPGVLGGSEAVMAEAASGFGGRGHDVEVITTCALDHYGWANELPEGVSEEKGLVVRRFRVERRPSRAALGAQLSIQAGRVPDLDHQVSWLGFQFAAPGLFEHVLRFERGYDAIVFSPYLFWSTTVCAPLVAEKAVVMPCLHDETYARLEVTRPVLASPALVWFLSGPEHELAHRLGPVSRRHSVTGTGVPVPRGYDPEGFRRRHGLRRPFVLFAGRREGGKGLPTLLEALGPVLGSAGTSLDLDLVLIGKGDPAAPLVVPQGLEGRVVDLGFVGDAERNDAFAAALAFLQPSQVESFSRTAMEAWLAGRPVVALAGNEVLAWHCRRSGGGLLFSDSASLGEALHKLCAAPALRDDLGLAGRRYVLDNYTWPNVLDRMEASLLAMAGGDRPTRAGEPAPGHEPALEPAMAPGYAPALEPAMAPGYEPALEPAMAPAPAPVKDQNAKRRTRRYLVAGSYPPLPGQAPAATLAAVRRAWAEGAEVDVASPRPSAAKYVLASGKPLGRQLAALRRREGCDGVVLCVEPGWPLMPVGSSRRRSLGGRRRRAVGGLTNALLGFSYAEVVVTGAPGDLVDQLDALAPLWPAVHKLTASSEALLGDLTARTARARGTGSGPAGFPAGSGPAGSGPHGSAHPGSGRVPAVRVVEPQSGTGPLRSLHGGAGPLEPGELLLATRTRRALGRLFRKVLGRHAPAVRVHMEKLLRSARPASGARRRR